MISLIAYDLKKNITRQMRDIERKKLYLLDAVFLSKSQVQILF